MLPVGKLGNVAIKSAPDVPRGMDEPPSRVSHAFPGRANGAIISQRAAIKVRSFHSVPSTYLLTGPTESL